MRQLVRYFSFGLITAGIIMFIGIYFTDKNNSEELSVEQLIPMIEAEGYHVLDNNEYISMTIDTDENKDAETEIEENEKQTDTEGEKSEDNTAKDNKEEAKEEDNKEEQESETTYVINVESGMHTSFISDLLEENNIVKDSSEFNEYLIENDYHLKVQLGEVEVSSDMGFYELAEALTN